MGVTTDGQSVYEPADLGMTAIDTPPPLPERHQRGRPSLWKQRVTNAAQRPGRWHRIDGYATVWSAKSSSEGARREARKLGVRIEIECRENDDGTGSVYLRARS